jgi:hypothetical protein
MNEQSHKEERDTLLKKLEFLKASGVPLAGTIHGDFQLSATSELLETLEDAIARCEQLLEPKEEEVVEHRFPTTKHQSQAEAKAMGRFVDLMRQGMLLGKPEVFEVAAKAIRKNKQAKRPKLNPVLSALLFESQDGPVNVLDLAGELAAGENEIPSIEKTLRRYCLRFGLHVLPSGRPRARNRKIKDD